MKKTINGSRYDTRAPGTIKVHQAQDGNQDDLRWWTEALYRTARWKWFIVGAGGPFSRYGQRTPSGRMVGGGPVLQPVVVEDAYQWLLEAGRPDLAEKYFADPADITMEA